ncbi:serine hydroxymethyltransferase [Paraburkholderia sabiae]|uniref:Serine hydroxymethyltransferase n=1 Tax=Paraburkholderia sabiae TaxID=273251 RepID=A0ABU9QL31_9BURK|nr:serine hydroxymethyltransferase [Paraburkholderia sabiae]WJZ77377.1 serine hydroxymethyltransferase [Paraburkholderia sabiae]CAD6547541.1 Serine hydroxymethyltransferase [Paraburkholderia sabiae]
MSRERSTNRRPVTDVEYGWRGWLVADDPDLDQLVDAECRRQESAITLVASENFSSPRSRVLEGSALADKNAEGYPDRRFAAGCEYVDAIENLAIARLKKLFGCEHANVQAMSATIANVALLQAVLKAGDPILSMRLSDGGHLSHGAAFHMSGRLYHVCHYGLNETSERIDIDEVRRLAKEARPKLIVCGGSSYPRNIDYAAFADIAKEVGALLWADIAHVAGLMAARVVPSAIPYADFVTSSTHKTWRGPRGGSVLMCRQEWGHAIDRAIFPGIQGAPKMDMIAARAAHFMETAEPEFTLYSKAVLDNAQALAEGLRQEGVRLVTGGTDTHLVLANVTDLGLTGQQAERLLTEVGVTTNRNMIPFDRQPPSLCSGVRMGSAAMTTRGLDESDFLRIGALIGSLLNNPGDPDKQIRAKAIFGELVQGLPLFSERWLPQHSPTAADAQALG